MRHSPVGLVVCSVLVTVLSIAGAHTLPAAEKGIVTSPNPVFITSVWGNGDLGSWPDSGGTVGGLGAADAICQARAAAAGLPDSNLFIAWISDSSDDAYCRIHGLTGTKAANCGLSSLPSYAGPWARTDGHPFGAAIHLLLGSHGEVYIPVILDEFGDVALSKYVFTATDLNGEYDAGTSAACSDWGSAAALMVPAGSGLRTSQSWTKYGSAQCSSSLSLLCMLPGNGPPLTPLSHQGALAFMTSSMGQGRLEDWPEAGGYQGLAAADNICLLRAMAGGLPHPEEFKAWLSTSTVDAADRFTFAGPWVRPDGVIVAHTKAELVSGELHAPINQTVFGEYWGNHGVWTGSTNLGDGSGATCFDWTSDQTGNPGTTGAANSVDQWCEFGSATDCSSFGSLYCLSNVPSAIRIFLDGFESGDTTRWDTTFP